MKQNDDSGLPSTHINNTLLGYGFPESMPIFWGAEQYIEDNKYVAPKNWKYDEYLGIPRIVRFLHDSGTTDSGTADNGDGGGGDPDPTEGPWELFQTCVSLRYSPNDPYLNTLPWGWQVFEAPIIPYPNPRGDYECIAAGPNELLECSINNPDIQLRRPVLILQTVNSCEFYRAGTWHYRGTVGGAIAEGYYLKYGYVTVWAWKKLRSPGLYSYYQTQSCGLTSSPKITPTNLQEFPWVPDSALPPCP